MSKTAQKTAPAKKLNLTKYLPLALLLIGLVIMTVCFLSVNSRLYAANTQLVQTQAALNTANAQLTALGATPAETPAIVVDDVNTAEILRLQSELEATATELAEKIAALEVSEASAATLQEQLSAAQATAAELETALADKQAQLDAAAATLEEVLGVLNLITAE